MIQKNNPSVIAVAFMAFMMFVVGMIGFVIYKNMETQYVLAYLLTGSVSSLVFSFMVYKDFKDEVTLHP